MIAGRPFYVMFFLPLAAFQLSGCVTPPSYSAPRVDVTEQTDKTALKQAYEECQGETDGTVAYMLDHQMLKYNFSTATVTRDGNAAQNWRSGIVSGPDLTFAGGAFQNPYLATEPKAAYGRDYIACMQSRGYVVTGFGRPSVGK